MTALTVRLADDKHQRLRALAASRGTTLNRLIDEMTTVMLVEFDAETRFMLRAARGAGQTQRGLQLLDQAVGEKQAKG
jgi:predicted transcriptional regulator